MQTEHPVSMVLGGEYTYLPFLLDKTISVQYIILQVKPRSQRVCEKIQQELSAPCLVLTKSCRKMNHVNTLADQYGNWMLRLHSNSSIDQPLAAALFNYAIEMFIIMLPSV